MYSIYQNHTSALLYHIHECRLYAIVEATSLPQSAKIDTRKESIIYWKVKDIGKSLVQTTRNIIQELINQKVPFLSHCVKGRKRNIRSDEEEEEEYI